MMDWPPEMLKLVTRTIRTNQYENVKIRTAQLIN